MMDDSLQHTTLAEKRIWYMTTENPELPVACVARACAVKFDHLPLYGTLNGWS